MIYIFLPFKLDKERYFLPAFRLQPFWADIRHSAQELSTIYFNLSALSLLDKSLLSSERNFYHYSTFLKEKKFIYENYVDNLVLEIFAKSVE